MTYLNTLPDLLNMYFSHTMRKFTELLNASLSAIASNSEHNNNNIVSCMATISLYHQQMLVQYHVRNIPLFVYVLVGAPLHCSTDVRYLGINVIKDLTYSTNISKQILTATVKKLVIVIQKEFLFEVYTLF